VGALVTAVATSLDLLVAGDPVLTSRDRLLDVEDVSAALSRRTGREVEVEAVRKVKYRFGESLRVLYDGSIDGVAGLVSCRARAPGSLHNRRDSPWVRVPDLGAGFWRYPDDRGLPAMAAFVGDADVRQRICGRQVDVVRRAAYAPEKRATFSCEHAGDTFGYLKFYGDGGEQPSAAIHTWIGGHLGSSGIASPVPIHTHEGARAVLFSVVPGDPLGSDAGCSAWQLLGESTAILHSVPPPGFARPHGRLSVARVRSAAEVVARACPDVADPLNQLVGTLATLELRPRMQVALLHADLHPKNVLRGPDGVGFVDLDQAGVGHVGADLGSALAERLCHDAVHGGHNGRREARTFLDGYERQGGLVVGSDLAWFTAAALVAERALRAVNKLRADVLVVVPELNEIALGLLQSGEEVAS